MGNMTVNSLRKKYLLGKWWRIGSHRISWLVCMKGLLERAKRTLGRESLGGVCTVIMRGHIIWGGRGGWRRRGRGYILSRIKWCSRDIILVISWIRLMSML